MSSREEEPRARGRHGALPDRVAQLYYSHGLICSSYPVTTISVAIAVVLLCCYPLVHLPLPGNLPKEIWGLGPNATFRATGEPPWCYVQQVILRTTVAPWKNGLTLGDAFRAPLYEAFKLLDVVRNYQSEESLKTLGHVCLHVEAVKKNKDDKSTILPQYSCLILSPANLWEQDVQKFAQDSSLLSTIFDYQNIQKGKVSLAEMVFGMNMKDTGIKRYPIRNRQRVLQYAITIFLKEHDERFLSGLRNKLFSMYPLHQNAHLHNTTDAYNYNETIHIFYPGDFNYVEIIPLTITFMCLFLYIYFSVRKIELIKSKIGIAFAAVMTVLASLSMSVGVCFFFGLTLSLQGKEIFPYLVILVGLENVLVLTKSVVSTPSHLDVKIRVAQGLSKEGWPITKNLMLELTILTVGLFTFVPVIQEFCIFSIVSLATDFFLQMVFFSTVLGIDTRRMEISAEKTDFSYRNTLYQSQNYYDKQFGNNFNPNSGLIRSKSHPRLNCHTNIVAGQNHTVQEKKIPKRLRLVNIWARTRFFQRAFMFLMVVWISMIAYNSGIVEHFTVSPENNQNATPKVVLNYSNLRYNIINDNAGNQSSSSTENYINYVTQTIQDLHPSFMENNTDDLNKLKHSDYSSWTRLSTQHWPAILKKYNISLSGNYIAVLPNIRISHIVSPEQAILLRNSEEKDIHTFQWQALAAALDPIYSAEGEGSTSSGNLGPIGPQSDRPFYPTSPMEILLTTILCFISVAVLAYLLVVLYRCVCSRNYAEWRASWYKDSTEETDVPVHLEAVPVILDGHSQEVECIASDGSNIVSSCLSGQIKVWDAGTGELITNIDRKTYFMGSNKTADLSPEYDDTTLSDYESGSPPSRDENFLAFPSLQQKINTNFSNLKLEPATMKSTNIRYDFGAQYRQLYLNHDREQKLRHRNSDTIKWVINQSNNVVSGSSSCSADHQMVANDASAPVTYCNNTIKTTNSCEKLTNHLQQQYHQYQQHNGVESASVVSKVFSIAGDQCKVSPIWCMDFFDNLVVIGCANGRLEFWEGTSGKLKCVFEDGTGVGVTSLRLIGSRIVASRLGGTLDFLQLQSYSQGRPIDWGFTCAYRRTHVRSGSTGSIVEGRDYIEGEREELRCLKILSVRAHQQPITVLEAEGGRVLSGSQDHTLKVFRLEDGTPLYTLHGHCGPITCLFIDRVCPATSGSGSQDGLLCVWDLMTGACMYSIQAHDGSVISLTYSASYVISLGSDERLCVWERFQGHLLNTVQVTHTFPSYLLMLTPHLVVAARAGGLVVWDVRTGDTVRSVALGHPSTVFVKQMLMLRDAVLCDYGHQLRIVRFPLITRKYD